ncbi:hypothetical protein [Microbacterium sp. MYb62]|uniref:hypothetical protein n=1 Tax=Microbacterium sp. MYb62 TaxID=1848690 RepID=UPI000CFD7949|nr:hypothetical protein [Microbacterium sp. MYb62]PRB14859.1 hypothetical protein CQ042_10680 [Microbacterium sp. MYb62]
MTTPTSPDDAAPADGPSHVDDAMLMHPALAADWALWSGVVSHAALARLRRLDERFPELTTAVLSTADGQHIASVGVDDETGERLAAMNGSLFGVARAEAEIISGGTEPSLSAVVSVSIGQSQLSLLSFLLAPYGQLLLSVSASGVQLGTVIVQARSAAYELITALGLAGAPA